MSASTYWSSDYNRSSEKSGTACIVKNLSSSAESPQMLPNPICKETTTTTINDWLRQHHQHQQQQQQSGPQSKSQPVQSFDAFFIKSDRASQSASQSSSTAAVPEVPEVDIDQLTELTESERDYQMDLNAAVDVESSSAIGTVVAKTSASIPDVNSTTNDRRQKNTRLPEPTSVEEGTRQLTTQRWTAYDNVANEGSSRNDIDRDGSSDDDDDDNNTADRHMEEILRQCAEYNQRTSSSCHTAGKQSSNDVTISHRSVLPIAMSSAKNANESTSLRLELPHHQAAPRSPRTSPSFGAGSSATGSSSPSIGTSSKIKTNGSLTSPIHGRRGFAAGTSTLESSPVSSKSIAENTEAAAAALDDACSTIDFLAPCWIETPGGKTDAESKTNKTRGSELISADEYRIDGGNWVPSAHCDWPGDDDEVDYDEVLSADWSEDDAVDDVSHSDNRSLFSTHPQPKVSNLDEVSLAARMSSPLTTTASIERRNRDRQASEMQLSILGRRMKDIEELEEKAIREVMADLETVDDVMASELSELDAANHRLSVIKHQQMELLLEAAKEREDADRQMATERRRLRSFERTCQVTSERLQSRDDNHSNEGEDVVDEVELRMTLRRHQDAIDSQRRRIDDLEFQLLEMETRREGEREPFQKKLMTERARLLQTCSLRRSSLQSLYLQKLEILSQAKADVADLGKEYQLLVEAYAQEKQKLSEIARADSENEERRKSEENGFPHKEIDQVSDSDDQRASPRSSDCKANNSSRASSTLSWKQGVLWRTLMELEAHIVSDKPSSTDDGENDGQHTPDGNDDNSRRQRQRNREWNGESNAAESEKSSDDVSCSGLSRNHDNGISSSGNTLDDLEDFFGGGLLRSNVEAADGGQCFKANNTAGYDDTWSQRSESADCNSDEASGTASATAASADSSTATGSHNRIVYRKKRSASRQSRPMTRYLPVRDGGVDTTQSAFNLRQFIESSGHVIDDGPDAHIYVTPVACHGWLVKMAGSRRRLHVWHRRYFLFDRTWRTLTWYPSRVNPSTVKPPTLSGGGRCCVPFGQLADVFVDHLQKAARSPSPSLTFCIKTRDRCIYVVAPSAEVMRIWIDALVTGAEAYGEFW